MDFVHWTQILSEAFYILHRKNTGDNKQNILKGLPRPVRKKIAGMNKPVFLTGSQKAALSLVVHKFCRKFQHLYAKAELLDLLEAVITFVDDKKITRGTLCGFTATSGFFLRLAYTYHAAKKIAGD